MTSGNDGWALDALARGDVSALAARLNARTCPPEVVRRLIRHDEPRSRLRAFLHGRVDLAVTPRLARCLNAVGESELRAGGAAAAGPGAPDTGDRDGDSDSGDEAVRERVARVAAELDPPDVQRLISP